MGNNSALIYRIASDNDGGFFTMEESTGVIRSASLFRDKKGQWFEIMVTAFDNHGKPPNNQAEQEARVRVSGRTGKGRGSRLALTREGGGGERVARAGPQGRGEEADGPGWGRACGL